MKRVVTAVILLIILTLGCFGASRYVERTTSHLDDMAAVVYTQIEAGHFDTAQKQMETCYAAWQRWMPPLSALVRHNEVDDLDRLYQRTRQALDNRDKNESLLQLRELRSMLHHLPEMEKPTYANLL